MATVASNASFHFQEYRDFSEREYDNSIFNTPSLSLGGITSHDIDESSNNRIYLAARGSILKQYDEMSDFFEDLPISMVLIESLKTLNKILDYNPDVISFELTHEESILFTLKVKEYTLFIQHFFHPDFLDEDEALLSAYKQDDILPNYAGSLDRIFDAVSDYLDFPRVLKLY